jgi:hypothetical protein
MAFCKPDFIIINSNYFQNAQKGECFLDDFEPGNLRSRSRHVILKVGSEFKNYFQAFK